MIRRALSKNGIRVGRSVSGTMLWVIDPEFPHPNPGRVYAFNLKAGEMREYGDSEFYSRLREVADEGREAAIVEYLRWKQAEGGSFAEEVARSESIRAEAAHKREREAALAKALARERRMRPLREMMMQAQTKDAAAIRRAVEARQIPFLAHFTRLENLAGILEKGILPVSSLGEAGICNDDMRLDRYPEAVSLSVSFPNYKMFYKYRCLNPDANWAVMEISPEALAEIPSLFFPSNAADARFRSLNEEGLKALMGIGGFSGMFADSPSGCRQEKGLPESFTTNPQAEVLAFAPVPPAMICGVRLLHQDSDTVNAVRRFLPTTGIAVGGMLFGPRCDWSHWGSEAKSDSASLGFFEDITF